MAANVVLTDSNAQLVQPGSPATFDIGTAASDRIVLVFLGQQVATAPSTITIGGTACTVANGRLVKFSDNALYAYAGIPSGSTTTVASDQDVVILSTAALTGTASTHSAANGGANASTSVSAAAGAVVYAFVGGNTSLPTLSAPWIKLFDDGAGYGFYYQIPSSAGTVTSAPSTGADTGANDLIVFPASGGAPTYPPVNTAAPTISGTPQVGQTLTLNRGTYTNSPSSYTQQWYSSGTAISGATGNTFVPTSAQAGKTITVGEVAYNGDGSSAETQSAPTAAVVDLTPKTTTITTTGTGSYTLTQSDLPYGAGTISLETWGGGASGGRRTTGGGGGAYSKTNSIAVAVGDVIYWSIRAQRAGTTTTTGGAGNPSWLRKNTNSAPTSTVDGVLAAAGSAGTTTVPGAGGTVAGSVGDVEYAGGTGSTTGSGTTLTGSGGGGAGSTGAGGNAATTTGGAAGGTDGGKGGNSSTATTGNAGTAPGGGGGSTSSSSGTGGTGARGQGRYTITPNAGTPSRRRRRRQMLIAA